MNQLPTEKRCREIYLKEAKPAGMGIFSIDERKMAEGWASLRGIDHRQSSDWYLAGRILSEHYGAASTLPERDEATGTGPATADRPADVWRESAGTIEQRDGKPEPKLELTPDERWAKQMARCEAMIEKQERLQQREEKLLHMAEKLVAMAIAKFSQPTAADIERTQELAKKQGWTETAGGMISPKPEPKSYAGLGIKIVNTYTDGGAYADKIGRLEADKEDLLKTIEDQKAIIADYEKRHEAGLKRGNMIREILSKEL